MPVRNIESDSL